LRREPGTVEHRYWALSPNPSVQFESGPAFELAPFTLFQPFAAEAPEKIVSSAQASDLISRRTALYG